VEEEISYQKYYQEVHNIKVREAKQPLLVSRPKKKDQRPGAPEVLYLLPELCTMTGITDEVRANFTVMKDLAVHTRIDPTRRVETCNEFMSLLKSNPQAQARLKGWGLEFEKTLVKLDGRVLPLEKIIMGSDRGNQPRPVRMDRWVRHREREENLVLGIKLIVGSINFTLLPCASSINATHDEQLKSSNVRGFLCCVISNLAKTCAFFINSAGARFKKVKLFACPARRAPVGERCSLYSPTGRAADINYLMTCCIRSLQTSFLSLRFKIVMLIGVMVCEVISLQQLLSTSGQ